MLCPACQRECRLDARFCDGCGRTLPITCSACGRTLRSDAHFCDGCGHALESGPRAPASPDAPEAPRDPRAYTPAHLVERILNQKATVEGARKHVTVLFADVESYTSLVERADPESIHALMNRCFQLILDEVHRMEGTVNQFTGDGVMALFGAPLALEDAPRRAVLAALAIQRVIAPLDEEVRQRFGTAFAMRIGIHSGPVVVGRIGDDLRMDYTAVGDTTNLAARIQQMAPAGSVWISESTAQAVTSFFELQDRGIQRVRGKQQPVRVFQIQSERAVRGRIEATASGGLTPLVGRDSELSALRAAFDSACADRGRLVFVVGEAGIGKSRLLYEFRRRLAGEDHTWFEGHCSGLATGTAFYAIADGFRRSLGIEDRDDEATAIARLEQREQELGGALAWGLPYLRRLLSLPSGDPGVDALDPVHRRGETFRALQAHFMRAAAERPLVFLVEDLHWIDPASEELLGYLADSIPAARVLMVVTYRPGYAQPFGDRSYHVRIAPDPLNDSAIASMAGSLLASDGLPPELAELIARKADGNPFFVEEVTRSLLEEGALRRDGSLIELARDLSEVSVPDRIQDVLMARLDRLPEDPRRAIQVASVIGREFALRLLEQVREAGDRVSDVIDELRSLELIYEKAAHPELAFMFKHALTHDVAYESILVTRRKVLHRIVGLAIEELYRDRLPEHYAALAHHFERAEEWQKAFDYHLRASRRAVENFANRSGVEHCRRALASVDRGALRPPPERIAELAARLADAHNCLSEFRDAGESFLRAAELAVDEVPRCRHRARAAFAFVWAHDYERGRSLGERSLDEAHASGDPVAESLALVALDLLETSTRGHAERLDRGAEALRIARRSGNDVALVIALSERAIYLQHIGDFGGALACAEEAHQVARDTRSSNVSIALSQLASQWAQSIAFACVGRYDRGLAGLQEALTLSDRCGDRAMKARLLNTLGWLYAEIGCHAQAHDYNRRGERLASEMVRMELVVGAPEVHANAVINLANNSTALGDPSAARARLEPLQEQLERPDDPWMRWRYSLHVLDARARVALVCGEPEQALTLLDAELDGARQHRAAKLEARALELRGHALVQMDAPDEAEESLLAAWSRAEAIRYQPVLWRADSLLAELARRRGAQTEGERRERAVRERIARLARILPDKELSQALRALGEALVDSPLAAYR